MTDEEYAGYFPTAVASLAEAERIAFGLDQAEAYALVLASFDRLVPDRALSASKQKIYSIECGGVTVGALWYELRSAGREAYLLDLVIWPEHRRRGFARAALVALERMLRDGGTERMRLNSFLHNAMALSLYSSLGYTVRSHVMMKALE